MEIFFTNWYISRGEDPYNCPIPLILAFLQERFYSGRMPSIMKVYVAAMTAITWIIVQSIWNDLIIWFYKKAEPYLPFHSTSQDARLNSYNQRDFERFFSRQCSCSRWPRLSELGTCRCCQLVTFRLRFEFRPGDCRLAFKPRNGYVSKVLLTPFKAQVIVGIHAHSTRRLVSSQA